MRMLKRSTGWYNLLVTGVCSAAFGCGAQADDAGRLEENESSDPVAAYEDPLLGRASITNCSSEVQDFGYRVVAAARFVAVSTGFRDCVTATAGAVRSLLHHGDTVAMGPYVPSFDDGPGDEDEEESGRLPNALFAATSTTDMNLSCTHGDTYGDIGWWNEDRETPETTHLGSSWQALREEDNGLSTTTADFYQAARQQAAHTIWEQAMYQWNYHETPQEYQSMPSIVGSCMETVMNRSAACTITCGAGQRPVSRFTTSACACVDDPFFDVGIIPDGSGCPSVSGRAASGSQLRGTPVETGLRFFMDNEDDAGNVDSSASGWIGNQQVDPNGDSLFRFCRVPGRLFGRLRTASAGQNYAVARMGTECPAGASQFYRTWDNEDDSNENYTQGHLSPHVQRTSDGGSYTRIEYCIFKGSSAGTMTAFPSLGVRYGVLGPPDLVGALATGTIFTDDENDSNSNALGGSTSGTNVFLTSGGNTEIRFARVR